MSFNNISGSGTTRHVDNNSSSDEESKRGKIGERTVRKASQEKLQTTGIGSSSGSRRSQKGMKARSLSSKEIRGTKTTRRPPETAPSSSEEKQPSLGTSKNSSEDTFTPSPSTTSPMPVPRRGDPVAEKGETVSKGDHESKISFSEDIGNLLTQTYDVATTRPDSYRPRKLSSSGLYFSRSESNKEKNRLKGGSNPRLDTSRNNNKINNNNSNDDYIYYNNNNNNNNSGIYNDRVLHLNKSSETIPEEDVPPRSQNSSGPTLHKRKAPDQNLTRKLEGFLTADDGKRRKTISKIANKNYDPGGVANAFATAVVKNLKTPHERESVLCLNFSKLSQEAGGKKRIKARSQQTVDGSMESCSLSSCSGPKIDRNAKSPEIVVDALKKQAASLRIVDLNSYFRSVFEVDDDGAVKKNSYSNHNVPASDTRDLFLGHKHKEFTPAAFIEARTRARLSENMQKVGDYSVCKGQAADWPRMEISFEADGKRVETKNFRTEDGGFKQKDMLDEIRPFAGSDQAITVLSAVLLQGELPWICLSHSADVNEYVKFDPPTTTIGVETYVVSDGEKELVDLVNNFGELAIAVKKNDAGDFVVNVTGYMLTPGAVRVTGDDQETAKTSRLCVSPSNPKSHTNIKKPSGEVRTQQCLRIDLNATLIISGEAAKNGEIEIYPESTFTKSYSGSFAMPQ